MLGDFPIAETGFRSCYLFAKFEEGTPLRQGIFYDGQSYDAYSFVSDRIREAKSRIVLIDNYVDDTVLTMLDKRNSGVSATIFTLQISKSFQLDIDKHNSQYPSIDVKVFKNSHDRFLIIDDKVYHFGASIKDLGKKWFAVSLMTELKVEELLGRLLPPSFMDASGYIAQKLDTFWDRKTQKCLATICKAFFSGE